MLTAVFHTGCALQFASTSLRNDKEVALEACRSDGFALQHCSESLKRDTEVVAAAMRNRIEALQFATQIDGSWACYAQSPHHVQEPELCRQARARRQEAIVSRIKANGFAVLVSDCHHVLEWPQALLPSDCRQGDILSFSLRRDSLASKTAGQTMDRIQAVLSQAATGDTML